MSRRFLFALSLFLALLLVPSSAFALDFQVKGVLYSTDLDGSRVGFVVSAYNQFDAACYALGKDPNTISSAVKVKLSDSNYGGRFYDYAESFFTQSGALEDVPTWVPAYVILISELGDLVLSDYQGVWYSTATSSLYDDAMADFVAILNGEDLGGGGSSPGDISNGLPDSYTLDTLYGYFPNNRSGDTFIEPSGSVIVNLTDKAGLSSRLSALGASYLQPILISYSYHAAGTHNYGAKLYFVASASPVSVTWTSNTSDRKRPLTVSLSSSSNIYVATVNGPRSVLYDEAPPTFRGSCDFAAPSFDSVGTSYNLPTYIYASRTLIGTQAATIPSAPVVVPPAGVWPEPEPVTPPTEPDLPAPSSPVLDPEPDVPTVTPTWPQVTINVDPAPTGTTPQDYTPWLSSILTSINSMRGELLLEFDGLVDVVRNVFNAVLNLGNVMEEHCVHIRNKLEECVVSLENYMRSLVHWLADQLRYDSDVTGDSDIFGVLSSINSKLGGGTYEPNPLASELAYYGWNDDLWNRFLLGDNWETSVSGMTQDMGRLTTRFPFSIPWDVVALFRLFVHDPVTPVFDLPLYFSSDGYSTVHVDLSAWDSVAALVRPLVFVIFALKLALLSRDLLSGFFGGD